MILNSLRFIDLFAGIGGFRLGFNQAGYQCVYSCEIDISCQEVYKNNFNESPFSDITEINIEIKIKGKTIQYSSSTRS